jgi:precorrin-6B methylase 2
MNHWLVGALLSLLALPAQAADSQAHYRLQRATPDGTGKVYMGREIAHVMGWQAASWLERPEREEEERVSEMIAELRLQPGMVVADIGAGSGYTTRRVAPILGSEGRVLAVDIQPQMLELIRKLPRRASDAPIEAVQSTATDAQLAPASIDLAFMVDVYHELEYPHEMLASLVRALKPNGQLVFVEYRAEDALVPIKTLHKMSEKQVRLEAEQLGLSWQRTSRRLPWQHMVFFRKAPQP